MSVGLRETASNSAVEILTKGWLVNFFESMPVHVDYIQADFSIVVKNTYSYNVTPTTPQLPLMRIIQSGEAQFRLSK